MARVNDKDQFENFLRGENPTSPVADRVLERLEAKASWPQPNPAPAVPATPPADEIYVRPPWLAFTLNALRITAILAIVAAGYFAPGKSDPQEIPTVPPASAPVKPTATDIMLPTNVVATPRTTAPRHLPAPSVADELGVGGISQVLARNEPGFCYDLDNADRTMPSDTNTI